MSRFVALHLADVPAVGRLSPEVAAALRAAGLATEAPGGLALIAGDPAARLADASAILRARGLIGPPRGESMPVRATPEGPDLACVDRSALRLLGFWAVKVHINGLVAGLEGEPSSIWLSRRSATAPSYPGAWDTLVAGGQPAGATVMQTAFAEAREEAGLSVADLSCLRPVRRQTLQYAAGLACHRELLVAFDACLPADFRPVCADGEIASHALFQRAMIEDLVAEGTGLKPNSRAVCADLLERLAAAGRLPDFVFRGP